MEDGVVRYLATGVTCGLSDPECIVGDKHLNRDDHR